MTGLSLLFTFITVAGGATPEVPWGAAKIEFKYNNSVTCDSEYAFGAAEFWAKECVQGQHQTTEKSYSDCDAKFCSECESLGIGIEFLLTLTLILLGASVWVVVQRMQDFVAGTDTGREFTKNRGFSTAALCTSGLLLLISSNLYFPCDDEIIEYLNDAKDALDGDTANEASRTVRLAAAFNLCIWAMTFAFVAAANQCCQCFPQPQQPGGEPVGMGVAIAQPAVAVAVPVAPGDGFGPSPGYEMDDGKQGSA